MAFLSIKKSSHLASYSVLNREQQAKRHKVGVTNVGKLLRALNFLNVLLSSIARCNMLNLDWFEFHLDI